MFKECTECGSDDLEVQDTDFLSEDNLFIEYSTCYDCGAEVNVVYDCTFSHVELADY